MNDLGTLCLIGGLIVLAVFILPRLMNSFRSPYGPGREGDYEERGDEYPRYDDPDIRSRGSFGGRGNRPSSRNLPSWIRRRSSGGSSGGRRVDSPNVRSRGSFGRSKD